MGSFVSLLPHAPTQTPADAYNQGVQQALTARNLMAEEQLRQQQVEAAKLQNWAGQRQQDSQQALLDAYKQAADIYASQQSQGAAPSAPPATAPYMAPLPPSGAAPGQLLPAIHPYVEPQEGVGTTGTTPAVESSGLRRRPWTGSLPSGSPNAQPESTAPTASAYMGPVPVSGADQSAQSGGQPEVAPAAGQPRRTFQDVLLDTLAKNPLAAQHIPAIQAAQIAHRESQLALAGKQMQMLGSLAGSVTDEPTKIGALNAAVASGLLTQDEAHRYAAIPYQDLKPQLASWQQQALGAGGQIENAQKNATHALAVERFEQEVGEKAPKTAEQWLTTSSPLLQSVHDQASLDSARAQMTAAKVPDNVLSLVPKTYSPEAQQQLQGLGLSAKEQPELQEGEQRVWAMRLAGATDADDYAQKFARVPAGLAPFFVQPEDWDKNSNDRNLKVGANPISVLQQESTAAWRNLTASQRQERIDQLGQALADKESRGGAGGGQTANSKAVDQRQGLADYRKLQLRENQINQQRTQLGQIMKAGKSDSNGQILYTSKKDGQQHDAKADLDELTDEYAELLTDKYAAAERAGMGRPRVGLDDALKAIGRGTGGATGAPTAAASQQQQAQATPPGQPAKLTEAQARQKAAAAGKDPEWYVNALRQKGLIQ